MKHSTATRILFSIYCIFMLWLLFHRPGIAPDIPYWDQVAQQLNLVPFRTLRLFVSLLDSVRPEYVRAAVINLAGNLFLFIPLGFFLPRVFRKLHTSLRVLLAATGIVCLVELLQLFTLLGSCDIDDLILNLLGTAMGLWLHKRNRVGGAE